MPSHPSECPPPGRRAEAPKEAGRPGRYPGNEAPARLARAPVEAKIGGTAMTPRPIGDGVFVFSGGGSQCEPQVR
jgi:hypothetical protein